ncbi:MAG TPA: protein kinase [Isosphaeraceae bacterium]|jgi:serine/threonine-protein kinase|nr:protein kinase [Isosphaeraceae bacterium]
MSKGTLDRPSLAGMKILVEDVIRADDDAKIMRISDRERPGTAYALKVVNREGPADDARLARCRAAAEASAKLGHAAILKYHDYRARRDWFRVARGELLMEYVKGKDLADLAGRPDVDQWILIFKHVAGALAHMQRRGVLHGDLAPGRVLLGNAGAVKVIGYGQSLVENTDHRTITKQFAAPELQKEKMITERTDIYAMGTFMYFLLTGKTPNALRGRGDDEAVKVPRPSALNPKVPPALDEVILPCVQRNPQRRPEGMYDVYKGLDDLAGTLDLDDGRLAGLAAGRVEQE